MEIETGSIGIPTFERTLTTEPCDVATLQKEKERDNRIYKALLEVVEVEGGDITQESLKMMAHSYELLKPHLPLSKAELINEERELNLRTYTEYKTKLYEEYMGRYVVIAKGEIQAVGDSFDDVRNVALDANHRFIFRVESKKKVRGRLRWPMKRK
jgi:hypothetical protein